MRNAQPDDLIRLRRSGALLASTLRAVAAAVRPGITTAALDTLAQERITAGGGRPSFLGFKGYPAALCTSINEEIVHGIPSTERRLQEGDLIGLDLGVALEGRFTDAAITVPVGTVSAEAQALLTATKESLDLALGTIKPGMRTGDLGAVIQTFVEERGFSIIRDLVGHGVGAAIHEEPMIPNFGIRGKGTMLEVGMVIAVEPMVAAGDWHVRTLEDEWTVVTLDGSLAAHFEHTLLITKDGVEVLTHG